ncbi:MAG: hypothetical protein ABIS50_11390 [Luteolibacter sp.]|uniref:hypothetical protein n=1 Tax=Luteolibacter sp. TaxID=1962973 RepID=UPI003263763B
MKEIKALEISCDELKGVSMQARLLQLGHIVGTHGAKIVILQHANGVDLMLKDFARDFFASEGIIIL